MSAAASVLIRPRVVGTLTVLMVAWGLWAWQAMPRREDPQMPKFWGQVVVTFPGADAETIESRVLTTLEEELAEISEIKFIESTARANVALIFIELQHHVSDIDAAWDKVRRGLAQAKSELPAACDEPVLHDNLTDQESIVLALTGGDDLLALADAAEVLERKLLALPTVARVNLVADPKEQVAILLHEAVAKRVGVTAPMLAGMLQTRNQVAPAGSIKLGSHALSLRAQTEMRSVEELRRTQVPLPGGGSLPLDALAQVKRETETPLTQRMYYDGRPALALGIVPTPGVDTIAFGQQVRALAHTFDAGHADIRVTEANFQPARVEARIDNLGASLMWGVGIVAVMLVVFMGLRVGLLVALAVPMVTFAAVAVYAASGGVLHQISIAALVIALGMLVDNAIVVAENMQRQLDEGTPAAAAATQTVRSLAIPLASATATTVAAFLPMMISTGPVAIFTRSIPVVLSIALVVSYLFAMLVTPMLARAWLRPQRLQPSTSKSLVQRMGAFSLRHPWQVLTVAVALVVLSLGGATRLEQQFFPSSDRNQFVLTLELPDGSHIDETDATALRAETALRAQPWAESVATYIGRSAPHFYYNLPQTPQRRELAQLVVTLTSTQSLDTAVGWTRDFAKRALPGVNAVASKLSQGPTIKAPVEVRIFADDRAQLREAANQVANILEGIAGTRDVRHELGAGAPMVSYEVHDAAAARHGLARTDVARALFGATQGLPVGKLHQAGNAIPIVIRSPDGDALAAERVDDIAVTGMNGVSIPVSQVARSQVQWRPAQLRHRNSARAVSVLAELEPGVSYAAVLAEYKRRQATAPLGASITTEFGGAAEGSGDANRSLLFAMPIGLLLLAGVLLAQFNSFRRLFIILVTVPLAAAGVVPGLLLAGQPFGFMSMLGLIALVGVVVNNAIVLLDLVEQKRQAGAELNEALLAAVNLRTRPILLTTATTVAGLMPLAWSGSSLWPPMAWAMVSGLVASTGLTLLVVPALYKLLFAPRNLRLPFAWGGATAMIFAVAIAPSMAQAAQTSTVSLSLNDVMRRASQRAAVVAAEAQADASEHRAAASTWGAFAPTLQVRGAWQAQDEDPVLSTPMGDFAAGKATSRSASFVVAQPVWNTKEMFFDRKAATLDAVAERYRASRVADEYAVTAADLYLNIAAIDARLDALTAYVANLRGRLVQMHALVTAGRLVAADTLAVELALLDAVHQRGVLIRDRKTAELALGHAVGLDSAVSPVGELPTLREVSAQPTGAAHHHRADLAAIGAGQRALKVRRQGLWADALPSLQATGAWLWNEGSPFTPKQWFQAGVNLTWTPFAGGVRFQHAAALDDGERALRARYKEVQRMRVIEIEQSNAALDHAHSAKAAAERGVRIAREALRVESKQHLAGLRTDNDLLEAESRLRDQSTRLGVARIEQHRAHIHLALARGENLQELVIP